MIPNPQLLPIYPLLDFFIGTIVFAFFSFYFFFSGVSAGAKDASKRDTTTPRWWCSSLWQCVILFRRDRLVSLDSVADTGIDRFFALFLFLLFFCTAWPLTQHIANDIHVM
jgi:hypothetical protein